MDNELNELKEKLKEHEKRITKLENSFKNNSKTSEFKESIKEFMFSKNPKDHIQKTLVIGFYLENYSNMDCFDVNDILKGYKDAKEKAPPKKRIYDKIASNIDKGYIMPSEKRDKVKTWELTSSGEKFVQNELKLD